MTNKKRQSLIVATVAYGAVIVMVIVSMFV